MTITVGTDTIEWTMTNAEQRISPIQQATVTQHFHFNKD